MTSDDREPELLAVERLNPVLEESANWPHGQLRSLPVERIGLDFGLSGRSHLVTELEPGQRIAFHHPDAALDFNISFNVTPTDSGSCTVQVDVRAQPQGWTRILEPIMRLAMPKRGERIMSAMAEVIESTPART